MKLALGGDTMLGRGVAERLETEPADSLFAPELVDLVGEADFFVLTRGRRLCSRPCRPMSGTKRASATVLR